MIAAWQEVEQKLGEGSQPENGKGPVQYAERSPNPGIKSQSLSYLLSLSPEETRCLYFADLFSILKASSVFKIHKFKL